LIGLVELVAEGSMWMRRRYPLIHTIHKEKEKGAKRKRNDDYDACYPARFIS
jgi:hypothetical protein